MQKVTQRDVAKLANVSFSTVSRVLNHNDDLVSAELRSKVEKAAQKLQYTPSSKKKTATAKAMGNRTKIGVLISNIKHDTMGYMLYGILAVADSYDIEIILQSHDGDEQKELRTLGSFKDFNVDAIIAIPTNPAKLNRIYEELIQVKFPLILLVDEAGRLARNDVSIVTKDSYAGAVSALRYLLDLGHRKILILGAPGRNDNYSRRITAYQDVCASMGIEFFKDLIVDCEDSYQSALKTVTEKCSNLEFTAIFAMNDTIAFGAWQALKLRGLSVPEDISIVGYDDLKAATYMGMTTVSEPMKALGSSAIYMAIERVNGSRVDPQKIILQDSLIIRNSCKGNRM